jgi:hypothetical protein
LEREREKALLKDGGGDGERGGAGRMLRHVGKPRKSKGNK